MTAMNAWVSHNTVAIATDTYCHRIDGGTEFPVNFLSKIYYLPLFKAVLTNQGSRDLGMHLYTFIQNEAKADSFDSLIDYLSKYFDISNCTLTIPVEDLGTIFLFGYSDAEQIFKVIKITFDENLNPVFEDLLKPYKLRPIKIFKPQYIDGDEFNKFTDSLKWNTVEDAVGSLINVMIKQKEHDDKIEIPTKAGIGGEIQITILQATEGNFYMQMGMAHKFDDYKHVFAKMKNKQ